MPLITSSRDAGVTTITLNRPDKLNSFSETMREDLLAALHGAQADGSCRVVILTGAGRAFCAGGDVEAMIAMQRDRRSEAFRKVLDAGAAVVMQITSMPKPVLASINGVAAGAGCNLALACDYRIASDTSKLGETFVRIGLHPDWGGTWLLPRIIGRSRAAELLMTGRLVDAAEALALGMVDRVVSAADLTRATTEIARAIAAGPPLAIAGIKRALLGSEGNDLSAQLEVEAGNQLRAFLSADSAEGMAAFLEKRPPRFRGE
jgi:enoyl-CoA hydratase/carnithine racemase